MLYRIIRAIIVPLANLKLKTIRGLERVPMHGPLLLAINHVSWLDPIFVTAALLRKRSEQLLFIAATKKSAWTRAIIPINRNDKERSILDAAAHLRQGHHVGVFPNGDQRLTHPEPKTGIARIALQAGVPVLPVRLDGVIPAHTWKSIFRFFTSGRRITVTFGDPMRFSQRDAERAGGVRSISRMIMDTVNALSLS
ncbi:MAG: 1-acyl-sn-glycerol-3-phosphate acyltransferase [Candidatus Kerfeldbacteria bacterium]|nr:1-acyl-sn-glycerol-3-phosphate acyltransferase [Candidatus Kerfeldbacteria bacterium]